MGGIRSRSVGESEWTEHEIGDEPMVFICHQGDVRVEPTNQIPICSDVTTYHGNRVVNIDPVAKVWAEHILGHKLEEVSPGDRVRAEAHVIGLCDLPIKLMQTHNRALPFFIKEPETFLHPSQVVKIADWAIAMTKIAGDGKFTQLPPEK